MPAEIALQGDVRVSTGRATRAQRLLLTAGALVFCALVIAAGEAFCRLFLDVNLEGNSRELFIAKAWGDSMGNQRRGHGVSFGVEVWTDENGFRVDPAAPTKPGQEAVLILGDSVGFGVGVPEAHTFAGLLRGALADRTIYNSSVIGYALPDYRNVVRHFVPAHHEVTTAVLMFCLNDVSHESASDIKAFLSESSDPGAISRLRAIPVIGGLNRFLRARSKLYLSIKNALTDPSLRTFASDRTLYAVSDHDFDRMMSPLLDIVADLARAGIRFSVVIAPSEPQTRARDGSLDVPQQRLEAYFRAHGIRFADPLPLFRELTERHQKLYLSGDAMHFSEAGHKAILETLRHAVDPPATEPQGH